MSSMYMYKLIASFLAESSNPELMLEFRMDIFKKINEKSRYKIQVFGFETCKVYPSFQLKKGEFLKTKKHISLKEYSDEKIMVDREYLFPKDSIEFSAKNDKIAVNSAKKLLGKLLVGNS